jgi:hypothetical protein
MALTACEPCNCIPGNEGQQTYRQNIRKTLCDILSALGGGSTPAAVTNIPAVALAFGSIGAAFATTGFVVSGDLREIGVLNQTNQDVQLSYDGGVTAGPIIPAGAFRDINFVSNGGVMAATTIFIKYLNGTPPTIGSVFIDGFK